MRRRFVAVLLAASIAACEPNEAPLDATTSPDSEGIDAARVDAFVVGDVGQDAGEDAFEDDAFSTHDAGTSLDASWGPCMALGLAGTCMSMSLCVGGSMPVMGLCPGPRDIQCCLPRYDAGAPIPRDAASFDARRDAPPFDARREAGPMCDERLMWSPNEGLVEAPGVGPCPNGMVPNGATCIDRYEASLQLVASDGSVTEWSPFFAPGTARVLALSREGAVPQGYIDGISAQRACTEAGKRLCTDAEWLRACQGPSGATYPYGNTRMPGVCNDARAMHPAVEYFGTGASWIYSELNNACINQLPASLATTGSHPGCVSTNGAFDMMGNLHEWTSDAAGTFRGGYYVDTVLNGPGCLYRTTAHTMGHHDYSTGFRCCQ